MGCRYQAREKRKWKREQHFANQSSTPLPMHAARRGSLTRQMIHGAAAGALRWLRLVCVCVDGGGGELALNPPSAFLLGCVAQRCYYTSHADRTCAAQSAKKKKPEHAHQRHTNTRNGHRTEKRERGEKRARSEEVKQRNSVCTYYTHTHGAKELWRRQESKRKEEGNDSKSKGEREERHKAESVYACVRVCMGSPCRP